MYRRGGAAGLPWEVEVNGQRLASRHIVIATGALLLVPTLPGLEQVPWLTSYTLWQLRTAPRQLLVLGGGPIGCELAQSFALLGVPVTLVELSDQLLPREERKWPRCWRNSWPAMACGCSPAGAPSEPTICPQPREISPSGCNCAGAMRRKPLQGISCCWRWAGWPTSAASGSKRWGGADPARHGGGRWLPCHQLPQHSGGGDVAGPYQLTHAAAHQGWYAAINALFSPFKRFRADYRVMLTAIYTTPEIARVGLNQKEARAQGIPFELTRFELAELDRAIADGERQGFIEVLTVPGKDQILGATLVGTHAGERIAEFVLAMRHHLGLGKILATIHAYPTLMEGNKYLAGEWRRARQPATAGAADPLSPLAPPRLTQLQVTQMRHSLPSFKQLLRALPLLAGSLPSPRPTPATTRSGSRPLRRPRGRPSTSTPGVAARRSTPIWCGPARSWRANTRSSWCR